MTALGFAQTVGAVCGRAFVSQLRPARGRGPRLQRANRTCSTFVVRSPAQLPAENLYTRKKGVVVFHSIRLSGKRQNN
jgi:hypothetical protein